MTAPSVRPELVWEAIRGLLWSRGIDASEVPLEDRDSVDPLRELAQALQLPDLATNGGVGVEALLGVPSLPDVVWLRGFDALSEAAASAWIGFLKAWATCASRGLSLQEYRPVFCVVGSSSRLTRLLPRSDVRISVRWWTRAFSALDLRVLCRLNDDPNEGGAAATWREHLLPSLAAGDLRLAAVLWDSLTGDQSAVSSRVLEYSQARGWTPAALRLCAQALTALGERDIIEDAQEGHSLEQFFADGLIWTTPEYGLELHTAGLPLIGRHKELKHRMWRGQVVLLLPLLDDVRLRLCTHLTRTYGADWPVRWMTPKNPEELAAATVDPAACQFGHLEALLLRCRQLNAEAMLIPIAQLARFVRNELAHYRPVAFRDYQQLAEHVRSMKNLLAA